MHYTPTGFRGDGSPDYEDQAWWHDPEEQRAETDAAEARRALRLIAFVAVSVSLIAFATIAFGHAMLRADTLPMVCEVYPAECAAAVEGL